MSREYRDFIKSLSGKKPTKEEFRAFNSRPGKTDSEGKPVYFTQQSHAKECNIHNIIAKYDKTKLLTHVNELEATYGDVTGVTFKEAQDLVIGATKKFEALPSNVRDYFQNSPQQFLTFMEDSSNREKAIELGLIDKRWIPEKDGLGEHVIDHKQDKTKPDSPPEPGPN